MIVFSRCVTKGCLYLRSKKSQPPFFPLMFKKTFTNPDLKKTKGKEICVANNVNLTIQKNVSSFY